MPFFSRVFGRSGSAKSRKQADTSNQEAPTKLKWEEAWSRTVVSPEEVHELIHECTQELKSRALDMPFLLLPFRPGSDPVGSKSFIRNFFRVQYANTWAQNKYAIEQELRLMDPLVLCSVMKWCWSRLPGGVVSWETYDLFRIGEMDSNMAKNAFTVFIPMSTDSEAKKRIIFDFFDLLAAIAARGKANGLGGRKLSRMAGWWAFEHLDEGKGFDGGYRSWANAADATSHLFFAHLRSLSPEATGGVIGISQLPRSLQALLSQTEYPPETPTLMLMTTTKVMMIVNTVSPTPFELLRRARNFEYRADDEALQRFSEYDDPVQTLTAECLRVMNAISSINHSVRQPIGNMAPAQDGAWSRFEDLGFSNSDPSMQSPGDLATAKDSYALRARDNSTLPGMGRPTTPSWADFLSAGFPNDRNPTLLPPDKSIPLSLHQVRGQSSQSHVRNGAQEIDLEPGELASINQFYLDETFWWVWMTSLAGEETPERKAVFGRCALIETQIHGARWLVIEEQIKGASPGQDEGAYIVENKSRFSWTRRGKLNRRKTTKKSEHSKLVEESNGRSTAGTPLSKIAPDQHAKIQAAAARLAKNGSHPQNSENGERRARLDDSVAKKTTSMLTLQPAIVNEAGPAMKWAKDFDRDAIRGQYLDDPGAGTGQSTWASGAGGSNVHLMPTTDTPSLKRELSNRDLPALPTAQDMSKAPSPPVTPPHNPQNDMTAGSGQLNDDVSERPNFPASEQHPALRELTPAASSKTTSPESQPFKQEDDQSHRKDIGGGGFKKMFSRKRTSQRVAPVKASNVVTDTPQPHKLTKSPPRYTPIQVAYKEPTPEPSIHNSSPAQSIKGDHITSPYDDAFVPRGASPGPDASVIGSREQLAADAEFSRFDQGPLEDHPSFTAEHTPDSSPPLQSAPIERSTESQYSRSVPPPVPTYPAPAPEPEMSRASEDSLGTTPPPPASLPMDRWAQIRKNAAERAQRMSEKQPGFSHNHTGSKTDDGETSGEETIESRVARIKARVAELTGNMETPASRR